MVERHPSKEEAARYVLGQLLPAAQHEFEMQLAQSAALRGLVQELEEGVAALARAVPQRPPPVRTRSLIEQAIAQDSQQKVVTPPRWSTWWRNGWAAAAACLLGWLGYALWTQRGEVRSEVPVIVTTENVPTTASSGPKENDHAVPFSNDAAVVAATNARQEQENLRWQIATLQNQVLQLSQVVARQQAILLEPERFKFFPLATNVVGADGATTPLSPGLQRALFYAMARELGWLPALPSGEPQNTPTGTATNHLGINFVDLNPATNNPPDPVERQSQEDEPLQQVYLAPASVGSSGNIPGFISGTNLVMAFDSSVVPNGSAVTFWAGNQWIGSTVTGDNPTVVTIPTTTPPGWNVTVTANSVSGSSNVIGQFFSH